MKYAIAFLFVFAAFGQQVEGPRVQSTCTFASPPSTPATGTVCIFTDASAVGTCSGGGGYTALATCRYSGSAWQAVSGGGTASPGGANTAVQYNSSGTLGGDATNFNYNATTHVVTATGGFTGGSGTASLAGAEQTAAAAATLCAGSPCVFLESTAHLAKSLVAAGTVGGTMITPTQAGYLDFTSSGQTQMNSKPTAALVTSVGSPGLDTNVPSEKAIRTAIAASSSGLGDPGGNGVVIRTSSGTTTNRTITGTSGHVTLTNGDGVSGNPTADLVMSTVKIGGILVGADNASAAIVTADLTNPDFAEDGWGVALTITRATCSADDSAGQTVTVKVGSTTKFTIVCTATQSNTDGSAGIRTSGFASAALAAGDKLDLSGTANTTSKRITLHLWGSY